MLFTKVIIYIYLFIQKLKWKGYHYLLGWEWFGNSECFNLVAELLAFWIAYSQIAKCCKALAYLHRLLMPVSQNTSILDDYCLAMKPG